MTDEDTISDDSTSVEAGEAVYDQDGEILGYINDLTEEGFEVSIVEPERSIDESGPSEGEPSENLPGQEFGEGYIMWRCGECGEMGNLDEGMPETCPNCGAPEEVIRKAEED